MYAPFLSEIQFATESLSHSLFSLKHFLIYQVFHFKALDEDFMNAKVEDKKAMIGYHSSAVSMHCNILPNTLHFTGTLSLSWILIWLLKMCSNKKFLFQLSLSASFRVSSHVQHSPLCTESTHPTHQIWKNITYHCDASTVRYVSGDCGDLNNPSHIYYFMILFKVKLMIPNGWQVCKILFFVQHTVLCTSRMLRMSTSF